MANLTRPALRILRRRDLPAKTGRGISTIYTDPTFPRPIDLGGGRVGWLEHEIDAWIEARIAARDHGLKTAAA